MPNTELTTADRAVIAKYLIEALGKEKQLETTLQLEIQLARKPTLEHALYDHLGVTQEQIRAIEQRLADLGHDSDGGGFPLFGVAEYAVSAVAKLANAGLALAKGPLVIFRGTSGADNELRMIRDGYWNEAEEIAHYRVIEAVALQLGDKETAELAQRHRADEEAMQRTLEGLLPSIVRAVVDAETPASERAPKPAPTKRAAPRRTTATRRTAAA